tara:strand:+ start:769 stop:1395 length:627 start_codon:yes stop_codon:yes gene_type:complete
MSKLPPLKLDLFSEDPVELSEDEESPRENPAITLDHNDIFDLSDEEQAISPVVVKKVKKKKEITQKQLDHLAKIRIKAQATRKAKAEAKKAEKELKKPKKKEVVKEPIDSEEEDSSEEEIVVKKTRKKKTYIQPEHDEEYMNYLIGKTYDRVKADRKAKKERLKQDTATRNKAQMDILQEQKAHYQLPTSQPTNNNKHDYLFNNFKFN